jgi:hypothetical protein
MIARINERTPPDNDTSNNPVKVLKLHNALEHSESLEVYTAKTSKSQVLADVICWFC